MNMEDTIRAKAKEIGAEYKGSLTLGETLEALEWMKTLKEGYDTILANKSKFPEAFCEHMELELADLDSEIKLLEEALNHCPQVKVTDGNGDKIGKTVFQVWSDYSELKKTKKEIESLINAIPPILVGDRAKFTKVLAQIDGSIATIDSYLDHCIIAMAEVE